MKVHGFKILAIGLLVASCTLPAVPAITSSPQQTVGTPIVPLEVSSTSPPPAITIEPTPTASEASFELIGHTSLLERGMNAALAVFGNYVYVGSRTDGTHPNAGVLVVEVSNPASPVVVHQIGPPEQGVVGQTSRELRVWPDQEVLLVLNFACETGLHACSQSFAPPNISIYDISGANAAAPRLIMQQPLGRTPHEMYLWDDPLVSNRALLFLSTPGRRSDNLLVLDISQARQGVVQEIASWGNFPGTFEATLHSLSISIDGRRAYLAHLEDGLMVLDTSELAAGIPSPRINLLIPVENWVRWSPGAHSAVKLFGKPYVLITEEVYGRCPWGWTRLIDITNEARPQLVSEYKLYPHNTMEYCNQTTYEQNAFTSFSPHNPTLTKKLAFITWHSRGLQVLSIENPLQPVQLAEFLPEPLPSVTTEDPALSSGPDKVVMWSYPVIQNGLIYVVDLRNGLYILKYHGPFAGEVEGIRFLEGNSNLGDAQLWNSP